MVGKFSTAFSFTGHRIRKGPVELSNGGKIELVKTNFELPTGA